MDTNLITSICGYLLTFAVLYFVIALIHQCIPQKYSQKLFSRILGDPFGLSCALISLIIAVNTFWGKNHSEEAAKQLEKIVESTEFIGDVLLPDSLEQTNEVRMLRLYQRDVQYYKKRVYAIRQSCNDLLNAEKNAGIKTYMALLGNIKELGTISKKNGDAFLRMVKMDENVDHNDISGSNYTLFLTALAEGKGHNEKVVLLCNNCCTKLENSPNNYEETMQDFLAHPYLNEYLMTHENIAESMNRIIELRLIEISKASYENALKQDTNK